MAQDKRNEALLCLLGMRTRGTSLDEFRRMSTADWEYLIRKAATHRVVPLLHHLLKVAGADSHVPAKLARRMREAYLRSATRNLELYHELSKVLGALQDNATSVIVLKGAALAASIYRNIALRPMQDVDILVRSGDIRTADEVVLRLGYENRSYLPISETYTPWDKHVNYSNGVIRLEIHPGIYEMPGLDPWINALQTRVAAVDAFILGAEDLLLHLCLHLGHHLRARHTRLIWWCDIIEMLKYRGDELDWDYVVQVARDNQVGAVVERILHVLGEGADGRVPVGVLSQLGSDGVDLRMNDLLDLDKALIRLPDIARSLSVISRVPSFRGRMNYSFRKLFPRKKYMIQNYSEARPNCVYFHYLLHIGRRIVKTLYQCLAYACSKHRNPACQGARKAAR